MKNSNAKISQPVGVGLQHLDRLSAPAERKQRRACIPQMPSPLDAVGAGSDLLFPVPPLSSTGKSLSSREKYRGKTIMKKFNLMTVTTVITLALASNVQAKKTSYEEMQVSNGGSISGIVMFKGNVPAPIMEDLSKGKNAEFCATHPDTMEGGIRPRQKVVVHDGKLENAVVLIENISKGKAWSQETVNFDFRQCDIFPKVTVIRKSPKSIKEGLVKIANQDEDTLHNPHGYSIKGANRKTLFNKPLPSKGSVADVTKSLKRFKPKKDSHFFLQCDQHNYMEADARIAWNPYYTVSSKDGSFTLDHIPAGKYRVTAWHPYVGQVTQEITVEKGAKANTNFELVGKKSF